VAGAAAVAPAVAPAPAVERQDAGETPDVVADLDDDEDEELPLASCKACRAITSVLSRSV